MIPASLERAASRLDGLAVLLGLSGGLDSTVLLHLLATRGQCTGLRALHVHHGLHPDADHWTSHCLRLCQRLGVALLVEHVQVERDSGLGLEAAARAARYAAFSRHLSPGEFLALAHHQDDQAETVLLRLLRASGSTGLAAMQPARDFEGTRLLRPLLDVPRQELHDYAHSRQLDWLVDPSNLEQGPDRNFLRLRVMPLLRQRWPQASAALAHSAELLGEDARLLREEAARRLTAVRGPEPDQIDAGGLLAMDPAWRARVLREWLRQLDLPPLPGQAIQVIESDLLATGGDCAAQYRWADAVLRRWRGALHAGRIDERVLEAGWSHAWDGRQPLVLPTGDSLRFESVTGDLAVQAADWAELGELTVSVRSGGERIRLPGRGHSHSLRHRLQEAQIAPWRRRRMPLLKAAGGELLAAGDAIVSARLAAFCERHGLRLRWIDAAAGDPI